MKQLQIVLLITLGVALTFLGDICFKQSDGIRNPRYLGWGAVLYLAGAIPIPYVFTRREFGAVFIVWEAATVLLALLIGHALYGEHFTVPRVLAAVLALGALLLSCR